METVLETLKVMGKASAREVASRMKIEPVEALNLLREQEAKQAVSLLNGYWQIVEIAAAPAVASAPVRSPRTTARKSIKSVPKRAERLSPEEELLKMETILRENGPLRTAVIAKEFKRDARGMISTMLMLEREGKVARIGEGRGVTWALPAVEAAPAAPVSIEPPAITAKASDAPADKTVEFLDSIPVLRKRAETRIPSLVEISKEIRKTKSDLCRLEKLQAAVREVKKHRRAISLFQEGAGHGKSDI